MSCGNLFSGDILLLVVIESKFQKVVDLYHSEYELKLKVNVGKSVMMVFKKKELEMSKLRNPYGVNVLALGGCENC